MRLVTKDQIPIEFPWMNPEGVEMASVSTEGKNLKSKCKTYSRLGEGWVDPFSLLMAFKKKAQSLGVEYINVHDFVNPNRSSIDSGYSRWNEVE